MPSNSAIQKRWIQNFNRSPFVNKQTRTFNTGFAKQFFHGKGEESYPENCPHGYEPFYNRLYDVERTDAIDTLISFLYVVGVRIQKENVLKQLAVNPADYHTLMKKGYYFLRFLSMLPENLNLEQPFKQNQGDIQYFIGIETGQGQLSFLDNLELPQLYNKFEKVPEGYDSDPVVVDLFNRIENSSQSFFITGKAGTGKSTFIRYFTQRTKKQVLKTAFTGIAAINVSGVTIHSFFRFPLRPLLPNDDEITIFQDADDKRKIIEDLDTIVIDEVSMLRADLLQAIDHSLRNNGGDPRKLFGGKQIIFVGDVFQLPPITDERNEVEKDLLSEYYSGKYFFDCDAYNDLQPGFFEFKKSHRQKEDLEFVELLDQVRSCKLSNDALDKLNARYNPSYSPKPEEFAITLATTNLNARKENERRLSLLPTYKFQFQADVIGNFDDRNHPADQILELKQYAQVIFIRNDYSGDRRWVNGTIGIVDFIGENLIEVKLADGSIHKVERETWDNRRYKYDRTARKIKSEIVGTFKQYPIRLAWAITIHKSQGLTFNNVIIDLASGTFANGQLYTALSRCRTLEGITLKRKIIHRDIIADNRLLDFYSRMIEIEFNK